MASDKAAAKAVIEAEFANVRYLSRNDMPDNEIAFIADAMAEDAVAAAVTKLSANGEVLGRIRVLDY